MKKILISLLAVAAIASCAKTEEIYTGEQAEIKIKPTAAIATKANVTAAIDGTEYPVAENFDVYAYWNTDPAGSKFTTGTEYLGYEDALPGGVEFTNKGNFWGGKSDVYYWPKNGSLRFAAYSPASVDMAHDLATDTYEVAYEHPSLTADTWDLLVAPTSPSYNSLTAAENVSVVFEHALSWITIKVVAKDAPAANAFDIKKVTINDVNTKATFKASMLDGIQYEEWSAQSTPAPYVVFEGSQQVTLSATDIETTTDGTIVIPQPTTSITVDYTQLALPGTPQLDNQSITIDLILDGDDTPWHPGKHYVYTLVFGLDEILINPDVADWEDVVVESIDVDNAKVSTAKQLADAVKYDGTITLQEDIVLTEPLTVAKNVALDLNGYTISYSSDVTGSNEMITVKGSLTIRDSQGSGKIVYDYTGAGDSNFTWGSYTINNQGNLVVEGGTIEVKASNIDDSTTAKHMYCAIQIAGNSKGTVIYGGTVKNETYRSLRLNGGPLTIKGGEFVGQVWVQPFNDTASLTINGGSFEPMGVDGSSVFVTNDSKNVAMNITGGNFKTRLGVSDASKDGARGSVTGGVYGTKPADALVAEGYTAAAYGDKYVVTKGNVTAFVATQDEFAAAAATDNAIIVLSAGSYVVPTSAQGKTITFIGTDNPADVQIAVTKVGTGGENCDYGLDGSTATFENITITTNSSTYIGYARCNATFKNCIFNGTYTLYLENKFEKCTFNVTGDVYNVWTWGAPKAQFDNCVFNSDGKALLLYGNANTKLTVNGCVFNDNGGLADLKAAIEIGNDYNTSYELFVNNTVVNGYEINDKGINTGTTLWANKNSMPKEKLNVVVDGVDVY